VVAVGEVAAAAAALRRTATLWCALALSACVRRERAAFSDALDALDRAVDWVVGATTAGVVVSGV
jgi:hypothetical protein